MKFGNVDLNQIIGQIQSLAMMIVGLVVTILLLGTSLRASGHPVQYLPALDHTAMAYLAGAWYLARK